MNDIQWLQVEAHKKPNEKNYVFQLKMEKLRWQKSIKIAPEPLSLRRIYI